MVRKIKKERYATEKNHYLGQYQISRQSIKEFLLGSQITRRNGKAAGAPAGGVPTFLVWNSF